MTKFYIPGVRPEDLHQAWEDICRRFGSWSGYRVTKRHIRAITYQQDGIQQVAEVGKPEGDDQIIAICELLDAYVCVRRIDLVQENPIRVARDKVFGIEYFE